MILSTGDLMIEETISEKESAFLTELDKYENKWVAIHRSGDDETVVGSGPDAYEAMQEAQAKGFSDAVLFKVFPFDKGYVPSTVL
jgi:hypothetical protein